MRKGLAGTAGVLRRGVHRAMPAIELCAAVPIAMRRVRGRRSGRLLRQRGIHMTIGGDGVRGSPVVCGVRVREHGPARTRRKLEQRLAQQRLELSESQSVRAALDPQTLRRERPPGRKPRHVNAAAGRDCRTPRRRQCAGVGDENRLAGRKTLRAGSDTCRDRLDGGALRAAAVPCAHRSSR